MKNRFIISVNAESGAVPEWLEMVPAGDITGRDGRKFKNSSPSSIVAAFTERKVSLPIDLEHATEIKAPNGEPAPAVGWIENLEERSGAVWAKVAWNDTGLEMIKNREYRYYSPVFLFEEKTGDVRRLMSAGLTNRPNLYVKALCFEQDTNQHRQGENMEFSARVKKALGLPETGTDDEALAKITALNSDLQTAMNRAQTPDLTKFVPRGDYDAACQRAVNAETILTTEKKNQFDSIVDQEIETAVSAGKITPATKDFYKRMCNSEEGLTSFRDFVKVAAVITAPSDLDGKKADGGTAINAEVVDMGKFFGNTEEDLKKYGGMK